MTFTTIVELDQATEIIDLYEPIEMIWVDNEVYLIKAPKQSISITDLNNKITQFNTEKTQIENTLAYYNEILLQITPSQS